jgi:hypothetical protein
MMFNGRILHKRDGLSQPDGANPPRKKSRNCERHGRGNFQDCDLRITQIFEEIFHSLVGGSALRVHLLLDQGVEQSAAARFS